MYPTWRKYQEYVRSMNNIVVYPEYPGERSSNRFSLCVQMQSCLRRDPKVARNKSIENRKDILTAPILQRLRYVQIETS